MRNIWVVHLLSFYVLVFKYRIRGDILGDNSVDISFSARAYVHPNDEKTKKNSPESIICPVIQTTWWYPGLLFRWNFVFGTCICSHKVWEDKRKMPPRASRALQMQTTWWSSREQLRYNSVFSACICDIMKRRKENSPMSGIRDIWSRA